MHLLIWLLFDSMTASAIIVLRKLWLREISSMALVQVLSSLLSSLSALMLRLPAGLLSISRPEGRVNSCVSSRWPCLLLDSWSTAVCVCLGENRKLRRHLSMRPCRLPTLMNLCLFVMPA